MAEFRLTQLEGGGQPGATATTVPDSGMLALPAVKPPAAAAPKPAVVAPKPAPAAAAPASDAEAAYQASRLGASDLGVNRARIERIRAALATPAAPR